MWNIVEFCKDHQIRYQIKRSWVQIESCPFCGHMDYKAAFSIQSEQFNCWACRKTTASLGVAAILLCSEMEAKEIIWGYRGAVDKKHYLSERQRKNASKVILPGKKELLKIHRKYIERRNFDPDELIREWGLMGTGPSPDAPYLYWKFRLVFPITLNGEVVSFQARDVTEKADIRYMGATIEQSVYHYKNLLYGQEYCSEDILGATEGIFDLYRMGKGFVCTFGTSLTHAQLYLMAKYHKRIFFLFDPDDPKVEKKVKHYCAILKAMGREALSVKWDGTDPGALSPEDSKYLRRYIGFKK